MQSAIKRGMPVGGNFLKLIEGLYKNPIAGKKKNPIADFPGGAVVKNPPANAGDMGLSSGPGRSHMPRSN